MLESRRSSERRPKQQTSPVQYGNRRHIVTAEMRHGVVRAARHAKTARTSYISFRFPSGLSPTRLKVRTCAYLSVPRDATPIINPPVRPCIRTRRHVFSADTLCRWYFDVRETDARETICVISRKWSHLRDDPLRAGARVHNVGLALSHGKITLFTHSKTTSRYDHSVLIENALRENVQCR